MLVSEMFFSVQGEGISTGVPSIFIRVTGCSLSCGLNGLFESGKATWKCDSELMWKTGKQMSNEDIENKIIEFGQLDNVINGTTHIIWTGGEIMIPNKRKEMIAFLDYFHNKYPQSAETMFNEVETNGIHPVEDMQSLAKNYIHQINSSPKLANSGMGKSMRINKQALQQINLHPNGWFKFVVSTEDDIKEIFEDFVKPFGLLKTNIIIMPGVDNLADLSERTRFVFEMAKKYNIRACTRAHILAWDRVVSV